MDGGAGLIRPCVASLLSESVVRFSLFWFNMGVVFPKILQPQNKASAHCPNTAAYVSTGVYVSYEAWNAICQVMGAGRRPWEKKPTFSCSFIAFGGFYTFQMSGVGKLSQNRINNGD